MNDIPTSPFVLAQLRETAKSFRQSGDTGTAYLMESAADSLAEAVQAKEAFKDDSVKLQHDLDVLNASIAERNKSDPLWRLHNLADAMSEDAKDSPYSQESWDLQEAAYREKCGELKRLMVYAEELKATLADIIKHPEATDAIIVLAGDALAKNPDACRTSCHEKGCEINAACAKSVEEFGVGNPSDEAGKALYLRSSKEWINRMTWDALPRDVKTFWRDEAARMAERHSQGNDHG